MSIWRVLIVIVCSFWPVVAWADDAGTATLQNELEAALGRFQAAGAAGDVRAFEEAISARMFAMLHNNLAASGRDLDETVVKQMSKMEPAAGTAKLWTVLHQGNTAGLVYRLSAPAGAANSRTHAWVMLRRFVREGDAWRLDANAMTDEKEKLEDLKWPPDAQVNGIAAPAEPLLPKVEYVGQLNVTAYGYHVEATINGVPQRAFEGGSSIRLVTGGLKKGENAIDLKIRPLPGAKTLNLQVSIQAAKAGNRALHEVYALPEEASPKAEYAAKFNVQDAPSRVIP